MWSTRSGLIGLNRGMMRIPFELAPVGEVHPWGEERRLHWFNLTQGWYGLEVDDVELLTYTEESQALTCGTDSAVPRCVDYFVVRFWEDLLAAIPSVLEPVPEDLVEFFSTDSSGWADIGSLDADLIDAAYEEHRLRGVDTGYLQYGPHFQFCRTIEPEDRITVSWLFPIDPDGVIAFTAPPSGRTTVTTDEFISAVTDFDARLMKSMQDRVDQLVVTGPPAGMTLDVANLTWQQATRRTVLSEKLALEGNTDWDAVRVGAAILAPARPRR